jgi:hypothetical protein
MPLSFTATEFGPAIDRAIVVLRPIGTRGYPQRLRFFVAWTLKFHLTQGVPSQRTECPDGVVFRTQLYRLKGL